MKLEEIDIQKGKAIVTIVVIVVIIAVIVIFGKNIMDFINKLFGKDDPQQQAARDKLKDYNYQASNPTSPFSPKLYQNRPKGAIIIPEDVARDIISEIAASVGPFGWFTDANEGYAAIQKCNTQADVSYCATLFQSSFQSDLYNYMSRYYTSGDDVVVMNQILNFVKNLPVY